MTGFFECPVFPHDEQKIGNSFIVFFSYPMPALIFLVLYPNCFTMIVDFVHLFAWSNSFFVLASLRPILLDISFSDSNSLFISWLHVHLSVDHKHSFSLVRFGSSIPFLMTCYKSRLVSPFPAKVYFSLLDQCLIFLGQYNRTLD